jgi:exopolysaccharide biosynthesis polyprenyl glycosylphosphotransferase
MSATVEAQTHELPISADRESPKRRSARDRGWLMRRMLLAADLVALSTAFVVVDYIFRSHGGRHDTVAFDTEFLLFFVSLPAWIVLAKLYGLYDLDEERADHSTSDELVGVFHLVTVGAFAFFAGTWLTRLAHPTPGKIVGFWALAVVLVGVGRSGARIVARRQPLYVQRTVIVGAGDVGQTIARKILKQAGYGIDLLGFVDAAPKERGAGLGDLALLGTPQHLPALIKEHAIDRVIVAFSNDDHQQTLDVIRSVTLLDICVDVVPRLFPLMGGSIDVHSIEGLPLIALPRGRLSRSTRLVKRTLDIAVSALSIVLLAPVLAAVAVAIKLDSPGPVFFRQPRRGFGDAIFQMFKFRTMELGADARKAELAALNMHASTSGDPMFKVSDDPRVTRFGRFLRRYSIDELPQLMNVLRGEMSLVGPRPLILEEDRFVTDWRRRRLLVKPGMTGIWQVLGRDDLSFEEMVELDYRYVASWSLLLDLRLLLRTLPAIARERISY